MPDTIVGKIPSPYDEMLEEMEQIEKKDKPNENDGSNLMVQQQVDNCGKHFVGVMFNPTSRI